ncbi:type III-B CRISPR module RAMP protein Cmr1 [Micromonospora sp. SH-82]|uniref:type III-B CRISPR module RAMP protein Cmr1 n=1 Tax=Micromonospora sp. SH-82 TaxID=3132938 RepID=UPI003EBC9FC1
MAWTTLSMQVTTPLFNGGHQAPLTDHEAKQLDANRKSRPHSAATDADAGVRVSSLRGAMRYWLRAMAGATVGDRIDVLAALESRVFGNTSQASSVALRIPAPQQCVRNPQPDWCRRDDARWIGYLAGQGLSKPADGNRRCELTRSFVTPGTPFDLQLRFGPNKDAAALAVATLWSLCRYGGLGARTRRGFGGLRIVAAEGDLPAPWTPEMLHAAAVLPSSGLGLDERGLPPELTACAESLERIAALARHDVDAPAASPEVWRSPPTYPVFGGPQVFVTGLSARTFPDWPTVLGYAGEQFRWFRATEPALGAPYDPPIKTREWLHAVNGHDRRFALGALGLPINFKEGKTVHPVQLAAAGGTPTTLRRASPLWLRPVQDSDARWRLLSFAFLGRFLPDETKVVLRGQRNREFTVNTADVARLSTDWITTLSENGTFVRSTTS